MPIPKGSYYRMRTYPSGKKVRLTFDRAGNVIEVTAIKPKATKSRRRLNRARRRIGL
jgi:YD repeat-containing protein